MKVTDEFAQKFDEAFSKPELLTQEAFELWADLEIVSDALAGPMYHFLLKGNYDYVYSDKENRFVGVHDEKSFRAWAFGLVEEYRRSVAAFEPSCREQEQDKQTLSAKSKAMLRVVELLVVDGV